MQAAPPAPAAPAENLKHTVWRDDTFFTQFPLNVYTVIDYFSRSPFYDGRCNNEECKRQGLPPDHLRHMPPGLEYVLSFAAEPTLYVIKCQYRTSPESATQKAFYYVLHGSIYQAPSVLSCLQVRAERCRYHVQQAFERLQSDLEPLGWRERHREKKVKRARTQRDASQRDDSAAAREGDGEDVVMLGDDNQPENVQGQGPELQLEYEVEREGAVWMAQPPPAPRAFPQWVVHTDSLIMNVLARHEMPALVEGAAPQTEAVKEAGGDVKVDPAGENVQQAAQTQGP